MRHDSLPVAQLGAWASINDVELFGAEVKAHIIDDVGNDKGGGLVATKEHASSETLLKIPADIILSRNRVEGCAKVDGRLRELLEALPTLTETPRGLIVVFLLYQMTMSSPDALALAGAVNSPLTDYVKFLPKDIPLPTFWTDEERSLLIGTSLADALDQKLKSLKKEYQSLTEATESIAWCQKHWWNNDEGVVNFGDWKLADAMYRSRAMELPRGVGDSMVAVVDMANHAPDNRHNARFEVDDDGNALLVVRGERSIKAGEEITIMYGCGGATEMVFSYGFLDETAQSAREVFLGLDHPEDDPLRIAKARYCKEAPGVRLFVDDLGEVQWDSAYVWWACVNEEDGLDFEVLQTNEGERELRAVWKGCEFEAHELRSLLMEDHLRDVFVLRALVLIQQRAELQGMKITQTDDQFEQAREQSGVRDSIYKMVHKLRGLELELVTAAYQTLEAQMAALLKSDVVRQYLGFVPEGASNSDVAIEEDFS